MPLFRKKPKPTQVTVGRLSSVTPSATLVEVENNQKLGNSDPTSSGGNAALGAFKSALALLGKAPLPGIDIVTSALSGVINGIQGISQVKSGWQQLTERMERLWYLISQTRGINCTPLIKELEELAVDIGRASNQGKLFAFFNSTDDLLSVSKHHQALDSIIVDLTATICVATNRSAAQVKDDCQKDISQVHNGTWHGISTNMENNVAEGIDGDVGSGNQAYGTTIIIHEIRGNHFGHVGLGGSMFSRNIVDNR